ncbi:MAG: polysaccharide pyruvyl transferase family protein [Planctomycetia bacterium]|jgi:hypothetical protein
MKIGIITFHFALSYGGMLQAYALQRCLELMGHEVEMIDYRPGYHMKSYRWQWKRMGLNGGNLRYLTVNRRFQRFCEKHLNIARRYTSLEELENYPPDVDAFVCGSDQIWCPRLTNRDPAYFLSFVPDDKKRIAYAGSFGKSAFSEEDKQRMGDLLKKLDRISCREPSGVDLVEEIAGCKAQCVLDPTLLIDDYDSVTVPPVKDKDYVLEIVIQHTPTLEKTTQAIASETGLPIIRVNDFLLTKAWQYRGQHRFPGPDEYLGFVKNAKYVTTNSFHGTIFSIIFQRPFFTVPLAGDMASKSIRMTELIERCGLNARFLDHFDENTLRQQLANPIDWDEAHRAIQSQREASLQFLQEALQP